MTRIALLTGIVTVSSLAGCWEEEVVNVAPEPRPVLAMQVGETDFLGQRSFPGRARASREVSLAFRVPGTISQRKVSIGDEVEEGDVIAVLNPEPFQADVARLEADLEAARADFFAKDEQFNRVSKLVESGTYSAARGDVSRAERDTAAARVSSVSSALERAWIDLSYTVLKAPYAGRVVAAYAEDFEEIAAQKPIIRLLDASYVEMIIDIPETQIALVPLVEELMVSFDAFPDVELVAVVSEIGSEASQTTRTYPVTIVMQQADQSTILPGMSGSARASKVTEPNRASGVIVPASSLRPLQPGGDQMSVWVINEYSGEVTLRPVQVGQLLSTGTEVTSGLSDGDWIVTAGTHSLKENQVVKILNTAEGDEK